MKQKIPFNAEKCLHTDPFEGDFGSPGDRTLSDKIAIARTGGECHECAQDIKPGELIRRRTDITEGSIATYRWCALCCAAMANSWSDHGVSWEARAALRIGKGVTP
jgi:hypothetical protein